MEDDLRPEYDLKQLLKGGVRGKYAKGYCSGSNLVWLDPEAAQDGYDSLTAQLRAQEPRETLTRVKRRLCKQGKLSG